jgi:hypothetical protein
MPNNSLAPHEMLEVRELLNSEIVCLKKMEANMTVVKDQELKSFMQSSIDSKKTRLQEMQGFVNGVGLQ